IICSWFSRNYYCHDPLSIFPEKICRLAECVKCTRGIRMKVNIDIDDSHEETKITIQTKEWTQELEEIVKIIKKEKQQRLFGIDKDQTVLLDPGEIDFIHAEKRKIFAVVKNRHFEVKMK